MLTAFSFDPFIIPISILHPSKGHSWPSSSAEGFRPLLGLGIFKIGTRPGQYKIIHTSTVLGGIYLFWVAS